jgi:hypothetical protein
MAIHIRRRELILALGGAALTSPLVSRAQQAGTIPKNRRASAWRLSP